MTRIAAALFTCAAMAWQPAAAQGVPPVTDAQTAGELGAVCDPGWGGIPRLEAIAYCQGFLTSFGQYHALLHPRGVPPFFCLPAPAPTIAQSGVAYAAWARSNPQHASEPALQGVLRWARATYPCPR